MVNKADGLPRTELARALAAAYSSLARSPSAAGLPRVSAKEAISLVHIEAVQGSAPPLLVQPATTVGRPSTARQIRMEIEPGSLL